MSEPLGDLTTLAAAMGASLASKNGALMVAGVATDTRTLRAGDLFFALRGPNHDGHDFVAAALQGGAVAAVVERVPAGLAAPAPLLQVDSALRALGRLAAAHRRRFAIPVVAITGSVGKTSAKEFLAAILETQGATLKTPANFNNEIGVPLALLQLRAEHRFAAVELAMRGPGQIAELTAMAAPTVGIVTNVGPSHSEFFASEEAIARAKGELLAGMEASGVAVLNADDRWFALLRELARGPVVRFGIGHDAEVHADDLALGPAGSAWRLVTPEGAAPVALPLPGRHQVLNALAAAAAAHAVGVSTGAIAAALSPAHGAHGRLEFITAARGFTILDDAYNASPASVRAALTVLAAQPGRKFAVLGEMKELGTRTRELHEETGRAAGECPLEVLVTVGPDAEALGRAAAERLGVARWRHCADATEAAPMLLPLLQRGDVVLVKGSRALALERVVEALRVA